MKKILFVLWLIPFTHYLSAQSFPDSRKDGKYYTVNGAKIWTVSLGKGDPIFLVAGGPGGSHIGLRKFDSLSRNHTLIYYDGFGRGKSDTAKNVTEYSLTRDIADLEALRSAMGFQQITILGHSYGSVVAQGYALRFPENVKHLILSAPFHSHTMWQESDDNFNREIRTHYPEVWDTLQIIRKQGYRSSDSLHQAIYRRVPYGFMYAYNPDNFANRGTVPYPNRFNYRLYYQMTGKDGDFTAESDIGDFDYRKDLKKLKMPILIIAGRYDRVAVPWMAIRYQEYCPQAQFVLFEKSGHNSFVEEPSKTLTLIETFLRN